MSKKNLLQESDIGRMMKFANIGALSDTFVEKLNEARKQNEYVTKIKGVNYYVNEKPLKKYGQKNLATIAERIKAKNEFKF